MKKRKEKNMIFSEIINTIVEFMRETVIEWNGFSFSFWEVLMADVLLVVGGATIGYFLRSKD